MKKIRAFFLMLLLNQATVAQQENFTVPDSLSGIPYNHYPAQIALHKQDTAKAWAYAQAWLAKSKAENVDSQKVFAYRAMMHLVPKKLRLAYADSLLVAAVASKDNALIGSAYLTRGLGYYDDKKNMEALDNFIVADNYISRTNDQYLVFKTKYAIALTKYYLGFYDEAISIFNECIQYFKEENDLAYLKTLHVLGLTYNRIHKYETCSKINQIGLAAGTELLNFEMSPYFLHSEGVNQYFKQDYRRSIKLLNESLPAISSKNDFANKTVAWFYLGKNYWALNEWDRALPYLMKVDQSAFDNNYYHPDFRENYELLIEYYKKNDNIKMELFYIKRLLKVDKILDHNYKYLSGKIAKDYNTRKLINAQQQIEHTMKLRSMLHLAIIILLFLIVAFLVWRHFRNKKLYRQKFEELMKRPVAQSKPETNGIKDSDFDINPEVVAVVLKNLEKFEKTKKFLEKDMSLVKLASLLNTNTKYVSKIILRYRHKKTIEYVTDLKIDYVVEILKSQNKYRNYTNKALGEEAGFGSTQIFTRAFTARNGISPTYFIQQLKKSLPPDNL